MRHIRIENIITIPEPIERPGENVAIFAMAAINLVVALAIFCVRFL